MSILSAGTAGGLTNLAKMPACNALVVGAVKKTLSGFSQANILPHTGYIYYTEIVQSTPPVSKPINKQYNTIGVGGSSVG